MKSASGGTTTSATPDVEVYSAVLPGLLTTNAMLIGISSPYRKVGLLHQKHKAHFGVDGDDVLVQSFGIRGLHIRNVDISDFKAELITERDLDTMLLSVEVRRGVDPIAAIEGLKSAVRMKPNALEARS